MQASDNSYFANFRLNGNFAQYMWKLTARGEAVNLNRMCKIPLKAQASNKICIGVGSPSFQTSLLRTSAQIATGREGKERSTKDNVERTVVDEAIQTGKTWTEGKSLAQKFFRARRKLVLLGIASLGHAYD